MGLFDAGTFDQSGLGWLSALLENPDLLKKGGIPESSGFGGPATFSGDGSQSSMGGGAGGGVFPSQQIPQQAQPVQAAQPPQMAQQAQQQEPGVGDRLSAGFQGLANSGSPMQAIGNLVAGLSSGQRSDPRGMADQSRQSTFKALVGAGVPPEIANAAALNPDILKTILPKYFDTQAKLQETGTDPITGQKSFAEYRPGRGLMPVNRPGESQPGTGGLLAPGVSQLNHSLAGDEYLNQFGPEVKAAVKAYVNGDVMPSGNPRLQGIAAQAKTIAQKYGADLGIPVSDALYSQKRVYRSQLGSNTPNSAGGQAKAFNQGIEHMSALADTLEKLDNSNGMGIPIIAQGVNAIRQGASTEQSAIADKAQGIGQTLAGEVGKLFSGSAGGGVHERELTRERFSTVKSKPQLAAALEATLETMRGGLTALEQRRDEILGPNSDARFVTPETEKKIAKVEEVISRLKGKSAPASGWKVEKVK